MRFIADRLSYTERAIQKAIMLPHRDHRVVVFENGRMYRGVESVHRLRPGRRYSALLKILRRARR